MIVGGQIVIRPDQMNLDEPNQRRTFQGRFSEYCSTTIEFLRDRPALCQALQIAVILEQKPVDRRAGS